MSPDISEGIETYKKRVAPWFVTAKNLNFATVDEFLDCLNSSTRISFMQKASQTPGVPRPLQQQYVGVYQKVCADVQVNPVPMTNSRCPATRRVCNKIQIGQVLVGSHLRRVQRLAERWVR